MDVGLGRRGLLHPAVSARRWALLDRMR